MEKYLRHTLPLCVGIKFAKNHHFYYITRSISVIFLNDQKVENYKFYCLNSNKVIIIKKKKTIILQKTHNKVAESQRPCVGVFTPALTY